MIYFKIILLVAFFIWKAEGKDCVPRKSKYDSIVCVCNSTYCDTTPNVEVPENGYFNWYVSSKDGLRLSFSQGKFSNESYVPQESHESDENAIENSTSVHVIAVNRVITYQPISGFGGAFTDSAGINILSLSKKAQRLLLETYFGEEGSRYNFGRVPIGCSDFSTRYYTYDDVENDTSLEHFQLANEDLQLKIPLIQEALKLAPNLHILGATWTPPVWMKTNNNSYGPGVLKEEYYDTYADYLMKFIEAYKSHGIEIWGFSTGNEPTDAFVPNLRIPSMGWPPVELGNWLANNLKPTIAKSEFNDTKVLVFDDQRFSLTWYADLVFSQNNALDAIDGIAVHWYLDTVISADVLDRVHEKYPNKFVMLTEASNSFRSTEYPKVKLGYWKDAEDYVLDIIENMRHWVTGWIDWNLALNKKGGPNWIQNYVDSPIITEPKTDEFFKQPSYYAIKHFSRFVERDSIRIDSTENDIIKSVAFETTSKTIVVVLYNRSSKDENVVITDSKSGIIKINLAPSSIHTIQYK